MKRLVLLAVFAATMLPATAHASVPCRDRIYNDWYADGKIASTYPIACYRDALAHVRPDARIYSNLVDDIKSAMRAAEERAHGDTQVPAQVGKGNTAAGAVKGVSATLKKPKAVESTSRKPPPISEPVVDTTPTRTIASGPPASSGSGIPTPIVVLGALALLLAAIGAAGAGVRHHRRR